MRSAKLRVEVESIKSEKRDLSYNLLFILLNLSSLSSDY